MHQSFISYKKTRNLILCFLLCGGSIFAYAWYDGFQPPNGGTWVGYTLGTIGALLIVWLMWFGIRKRSYRSNVGSVRGWLSAHVYLGLALIIVATLHTGFQFGWNIHTYAYALMCTVILSGVWGMVLYLRYPTLIAENRGNDSRDQLFKEVAELDKQAQNLAREVSDHTAQLVDSAISRTMVGGSAWAQLSGSDKSRILLPSSKLVANRDQDTLLNLLTDILADCNEPEKANPLQELITSIGHKKHLMCRIRRDIKLQGWLQLWLFLHIPLSFALLAALITHIITVFLYW